MVSNGALFSPIGTLKAHHHEVVNQCLDLTDTVCPPRGGKLKTGDPRPASSLPAVDPEAANQQAFCVT